MKRNLLLVAVGAVVMFALQMGDGARLRGDSPQEREPASIVAVLDVLRVLDRHAQFQNTIEDMKEEVTQTEAVLKAERSSIDAEIAEVQKLDKKSEAFKRRDEEVLKLQSDFNLKVTRERKVFLDREAEVYLDTYRQIQRVVTEYAQAHGIQIVIKVGTEEEPKDREAVLKIINKPVVYADRLDITSAIIDAVNHRDMTQP